MKSHPAVAAELLGSEELVWDVQRDLDSSALDEKHKALFRFVDKVNRESPRITAEDTNLLRAAGWDDEAHRQGGKRSAANGYARSPD